MEAAGLPTEKPTREVGSAETFRDEAMLYAMRLSQAGASVDFHMYAGGFHGYDASAPVAHVPRATLAVTSGTRSVAEVQLATDLVANGARHPTGACTGGANPIQRCVRGTDIGADHVPHLGSVGPLGAMSEGCFARGD